MPDRLRGPWRAPSLGILRAQLANFGGSDKRPLRHSSSSHHGAAGGTAAGGGPWGLGTLARAAATADSSCALSWAQRRPGPLPGPGSLCGRPGQCGEQWVGGPTRLQPAARAAPRAARLITRSPQRARRCTSTAPRASTAWTGAGGGRRPQLASGAASARSRVSLLTRPQHHAAPRARVRLPHTPPTMPRRIAGRCASSAAAR